ncbi:MAG: MBL fold metallo-hydrolase [Actinomycetota bacterium]|nr:MBL fold metallo-hydrolase [Actinomycetota bacterium]
MSEPKAVAERIDEILPGVRTWSVHDERIRFRSDAYAIDAPEGAVLVDPLPLAVELGPVAAIVLTAGTHQRSAWRLRRELGVPVWVPALSKLIEEEPDERYAEGDELPGGLAAYFTPGAGTTQHTLLRDRVAFTADLFTVTRGRLRLISERFAHDIVQARESAQRLLGLDFDVLCTCHGGAVTNDPKQAIRAALAG